MEKKKGGMLLGRERESVNREKEREGGVSGEKERQKNEAGCESRKRVKSASG